jgi:hypothetical protein
MGTALSHPRVSVTEHLILPAIRAEVDRLRLPEAVEATTMDKAERVALEQRRARILDMFESGLIDKHDRERRLAAVTNGLSRLDAQRVMLAIPNVDWTWTPRQLNRVLRAIFDGIQLDPITFKPIAFEWAVPAWRA